MSAEIDPSDLEDVRVLLSRGMNQHQIAAELKLSRHLVTRCVADLRDDRATPAPKTDARFPLGAATAGEALDLLADRFPLDATREDFASVLLTTVHQPHSAAAKYGVIDMLAEAVAQRRETRDTLPDVIWLAQRLIDRRTDRT